MKTLLALLLALAAATAAAPSAHAKGAMEATIWGASGSVTPGDPYRIGRLIGQRARLVEPPRPAPFYVFELTLGDYVPAQQVLMLWVPSARRAAGAGVMGGLEWYPVGPSRARELDDAVAGLEPYQPRRRWPPGLKSAAQISSYARATAPSGGGMSGPAVWALGSGVGGALVLGASLGLARRRGAARMRPV